MFTGFYADFFSRFVSNFESYKHETVIVFNERFTFKKIRQPVSKENRWLFLIKNSAANATIAVERLTSQINRITSVTTHGLLQTVNIF